MASAPDHPAIPHDPARGEELSAWLETYGPGLRRYFRRRAPADEIDDLVQEVFLRLQTRREREPVDNVERYLFRIAANALIDRRRNDAAFGWDRHERLDDRPDPADEISPERTLIARQEHARLIVAIRNLPPRTRAAFVLHRFEQMTYPAIARRMGVSLSAVKHLVTRALDHLGQAMEERP